MAKFFKVWTNRSKKFKIITTTVIVFLILIRLITPFAIKKVVLKKLNKIKGYSATIEDVDVSLFSPSIAFKNIIIFSDSTGIENPLFRADEIKGMLLISSLREGKLLTHSSIKNPILSFMQYSDTSDIDQGITNLRNYIHFKEVNWRKEIGKLFALTIDKFDLINGEIHFKNLKDGKTINVEADSIHASFRNMANTEHCFEELFSKGRITARVMDHSPLEVDILLAPSSDKKSFEMDLELEKLDITTMNHYWREYVNLDVERGHFDLTSEISMADGELQGEVQPESHDFDIFNLKYDKNIGLKNMAWQGLIGISTRILLLERFNNDKICRIYFKGTLEKLNVHLMKNSEILLSKLFIKAVNEKIKPHVLRFEKIE